ncbi:hypothetical protein B0I33_111227 [Prauserella shujinwangii]|uniref:Uncharacterized protein n=1 Tax=Prauserella shujinwangii TaxID=1453103 RepID=A0A2T0LNF7_9PSEU|nr:hypothetical protein [Prauserella shujinwangii]PRX44713.1 hypothetical protein B0I33_111227 [Prauserella shujinwangii]
MAAAEEMVRRVNHAVNVDAERLYAGKDADEQHARQVLRQRGFHLLELGLCEAAEGGVDTRGIDAAVRSAFGLPARLRASGGDEPAEGETMAKTSDDRQICTCPACHGSGTQ